MPSLIETVRIRNGVAPLWYLHLRRLAASCKALGVPLPGELLTPSGGADRIHRLEVGLHGVQLSERPVGSTAPVASSPTPFRKAKLMSPMKALPFENAML